MTFVQAQQVRSVRGLNCQDLLPIDAIASPNLPLLQLVGDRLNRLDISRDARINMSLRLFMVDNLIGSNDDICHPFIYLYIYMSNQLIFIYLWLS